MTFTPEDLERADKAIAHWAMSGLVPPARVAQLIADIRNETIERCAADLDQRAIEADPAVHALAWRVAAMRIRALKDGAK